MTRPVRAARMADNTALVTGDREEVELHRLRQLIHGELFQRSAMYPPALLTRRSIPQHHPSLAPIADRVQRGRAARDGEADHAVLKLEIVGHREYGQVAAEESQERLLRTEDQPTGDRVQPVGSDQKVKGSTAATLEGHLDLAPSSCTVAIESSEPYSTCPLLAS